MRIGPTNAIGPLQGLDVASPGHTGISRSSSPAIDPAGLVARHAVHAPSLLPAGKETSATHAAAVGASMRRFQLQLQRQHRSPASPSSGALASRVASTYAERLRALIDARLSSLAQEA